jgi:tRNA-specific 2-thiouridylase
MDLCFAAEGDYREAFANRDNRPGPILGQNGKQIGEHKGIHNYTIGQRKGLGISSPKPLFVIRLSAKDNSITLGSREEACRREIQATDLNILMAQEMKIGNQVFAKIRSTGDVQPCVITTADDSRVAVKFDRPQFAPAAGQRLVIYNGQDKVIVGGVISD